MLPFETGMDVKHDALNGNSRDSVLFMTSLHDNNMIITCCADLPETVLYPPF